MVSSKASSVALPYPLDQCRAVRFDASTLGDYPRPPSSLLWRCRPDVKECRRPSGLVSLPDQPCMAFSPIHISHLIPVAAGSWVGVMRVSICGQLCLEPRPHSAHRNNELSDRPDRARRNASGCRACSMAKIAGNNEAGAPVCTDEAPDDRSPERAVLSPPSPSPSAIGSFGNQWRTGFKSRSGSDAACAFNRCVPGSLPSILLLSAKVTAVWRLRRTPMSDDRTHEGLNV